jgi:biopolymer transport protein ExbB
MLFKFFSNSTIAFTGLGLALVPSASWAFDEAIGKARLVTAELPKDLSPLGMFLSADIIVKAVLVCLVAASILTWTIALVKSIEISSARNAVRGSLKELRAIKGLMQLADPVWQLKGGASMLAASAMDEMKSSPAAAAAAGIKERIASGLHRLELSEIRRVNRGTGILATIGAIAPFVGLFGTVWGIMNSFINISKAHTTNLAVVAPGIAEALLATAAGLVAAIPAVVLYNMLARSSAAFRAELGDASTEIQKLASRDLDSGVLASVRGLPSASFRAVE